MITTRAKIRYTRPDWVDTDIAFIWEAPKKLKSIVIGKEDLLSLAIDQAHYGFPDRIRATCQFGSYSVVMTLDLRMLAGNLVYSGGEFSAFTIVIP